MSDTTEELAGENRRLQDMHNAAIGKVISNANEADRLAKLLSEEAAENARLQEALDEKGYPFTLERENARLREENENLRKNYAWNNERVFHLEAQQDTLLSALKEVVWMFDLLTFDKTPSGNSTFVGERLDRVERTARAAISEVEGEK